MQPYYGTKLINAKPMTRADYNTLRGWSLPADENGADDGYLVEYVDSKANVEGYTGYVSWSPKDVFEVAYQPLTALSFGHALLALKDGKKVARAGWNGKGMFLVLQPATVDAKLTDGSLYHRVLNSNIVTINAHIDMKTASGEMQPGWLASQTDMLANDWQLVD